MESHGTTVAGLIALAIRGGILDGRPLANVKILPIRATTFENGVERILSSDAIKAVNVAIQRGARFINASWGDNGNSAELKKLFNRADANNIVIVAAAGNGRRNSIFDDYKGYDIDAPGNAIFPASWRLPNMVAVAALDIDEQLAAFSNWGNVSVQIAAPGVAIISPVPDELASGAKIRAYQSSDGTSVAAPLVTGLLGLYSAKNPGLTNRALVSRVVGSALQSDSLKSKVASSGRLSGLQLAALNATPPAPSQPNVASIGTDGLSEAAVLALLRDYPSAVQKTDAPVLKTIDSMGSYAKAEKEISFLVRARGNSPEKALSEAINYGIGSVNSIKKIDENLYSISVEAISGSKIIEERLKKVPGVKDVEKNSSFQLLK